jgi:hypothetical protein
MYIRLVVPKSLSKEDIKSWYETVKSLSPSGVIHSIQVPGPKKEDGPKNVYLIKKEINGKIGYEVPLSRDLVEKEVEPIVDSWSSQYTKGDFEIETSAIKVDKATHQRSADAVKLKKRDLEQICDTLAKHRHGEWLCRREAAGWRYGLKYNEKEKTHPMIRPWEQLPEEYKNIDEKELQIFMDILSEFGYVIVKKSDLAKWLAK